MADYDQTAIVIRKRLLQNPQGNKIQIIGWFVKNQKISAALENLRQRQPRLFSAGKTLYLRIDPFIFKHETLEIPPDGNPFLTEIDGLMSLPDLFADRFFRVQLHARLIDVIEFNGRRDKHFPRIRGKLLRNQLQKRGLARAVRTDNADFMGSGEFK